MTIDERFYFRSHSLWRDGNNSNHQRRLFRSCGVNKILRRPGDASHLNGRRGSGVSFGRILTGNLLAHPKPEYSVLAQEERMTPELALVFALITILGSGASVYVGVRVALAEIRTFQKAQEKRLDKVEDRLDRLEERYFRSGN